MSSPSTVAVAPRSVWNIELGMANIHVGFAQLKPAELVIIRLQQTAGRRPYEREIEMAQFSVNAQRFDPYKNLKFRVKWDGKYVAGVSKVSGLKRTTEVIEHREGGDPSTSPEVTRPDRFEPITLERCITHDTEFERWASKVWNLGSGLGAEVSLRDFRKDVIIELYNDAGQLVLAYKIFRAWVSEYEALPDLDANANTVAIERLTLENEGWERDSEVPEPTEPSFVEPA
jgi:phage tail-like protein